MSDKNIHGEPLPEKYRFTEEDERRLDKQDFYSHHGNPLLPPADITEADRFMAWRWYGQFYSPMREDLLKSMAWRISRERQLLGELQGTTHTAEPPETLDDVERMEGMYDDREREN